MNFDGELKAKSRQKIIEHVFVWIAKRLKTRVDFFFAIFGALKIFYFD